MGKEDKKQKKVTLPQEAIDYYDNKFDEKLLRLRPSKRQKKSKPKKSSISHAKVKTIDFNDISDITLSEIDSFGVQKSQFFNTNDNELIGLDDEDYEKTAILIRGLARRKDIYPIVSEQFIHNTAFEWFKGKYNGTLSIDSKFCEYLIDKLRYEVKEYEIRCPVEYMSIEQPFIVGNVHFDFFTDDFFINIEKTSLEKEKVKKLLNDYKKKYKGKVYTLIKVNAERNRAIEIAKDETEKALMVLRFFSQSAVFPSVSQYFGREGQVLVPSSHIFIYSEKTPSIYKGFDSNHGHINFHIGQEELNMYEKTKFNLLSELIKKKELTSFEETFLLSLSYFIKGVSFSDYDDKLVFLLTAVETLLLKNNNEPIQDNLARRLSFITDSTLLKRKQTIIAFKSAYTQRGKYLHHGFKKLSSSELEFVQQKIWMALINILPNVNKIKTKMDLINDLEDRILSG